MSLHPVTEAFDLGFIRGRNWLVWGIAIDQAMLSLPAPVVPFVIASLLSIHGLRRRSLSPSGAAAAFTVGFMMFSGPLLVFGVSLIVFYLIGSRATKVGKQLKAKLEDGHQETGYRTAWQVLCNSFAAFVASVVWNMMFVPDSTSSRFVARYYPLETWRYDGHTWCPLERQIGHGWSRALLFATLGHFACCLGDTLASELGILSRSPPMLITTLKTVPPGTNGAMSLMGTMASIGGGLIMGLTLAGSLVVENEKCRRTWAEVMGTCVLWGGVAGGVGSLLDSFMGATIQQTRYSVDSKLILQDDSQSATGAEIKIISGINILTNNQVNLVSSIVTALAVAWFC